MEFAKNIVVTAIESTIDPDNPEGLKIATLNAREARTAAHHERVKAGEIHTVDRGVMFGHDMHSECWCGPTQHADDARIWVHKHVGDAADPAAARATAQRIAHEHGHLNRWQECHG